MFQCDFVLMVDCLFVYYLFSTLNYLMFCFYCRCQVSRKTYNKNNIYIIINICIISIISIVVIINLGLYVQQGDAALLVDLLDGLDLSAEHEALEAAVLQELIGGDALGHDLVGDEVVLLPARLILTRGSGGVCRGPGDGGGGGEERQGLRPRPHVYKYCRKKSCRKYLGPQENAKTI